MSRRLFWIHEDALSLDHPALASRCAGDSICFIWDDHHLEAMGYGFQRLVFIYETLSEMGVDVLRGSTVAVLKHEARRISASEIVVPTTVNPALLSIISALRSDFEVDVVAERPFVTLDRKPSLRRFFAYWKTARPHLMHPG